MNTIVFLRGGIKHSAWHSIREAKNQIRVLRENGYWGCYYEEVDHNYENGHYFI